MARNGSGTYTVPNSFAPNDIISSSLHDQNFSDIGSELTNSLAKDGQTTMTGPLKAASGTVTAPGYTFGSDLNTGFYRIGSDEIGVSLGGTKVGDWSTTGLAVTGTLSATAIDNSVIGSVTPANGSFTALSAAGNFQTTVGTVTFNAGPVSLPGGVKLEIGTFNQLSAGGAQVSIENDSGTALQVMNNSNGAGTSMLVRSDTSSNSFVNFVYQSNSTSVGTITTNGTTTAYNTTSDERLKEDPQPFDSGSIIDGLNAYNFRWKATQQRDYGVFAQEAYAVLPQAIRKPDEQDGRWLADYAKFVPVLLAEVKALRKRVAELEAR